MVKVVLFGDSITAGFMEDPVSPILTNRVKAGLAQQQISVVVFNAGMPGDTAADGLKRLEKDVLSKQPDYVTVFFGANDCSEERGITVQEYGATVSQIIEMIGKEKVILFTPPFVDSARQPARKAEVLQGFVEKAKEIGAIYEIPTVDMYQAMVVYPGTDEFLQLDGLHFSEVGYDLLAALIVREIKGKLVK